MQVAKWKRKAKLAVQRSGSLTPGTPSRRSVLFSPSPRHGSTDDGDSDGASVRSVLPPSSRRQSTAMADLSNLMEQSLHDIRKDNELLAQQQLQNGHKSPVPLLLASPRILVHPSPPQRRPSTTLPRVQT